MKSEEYWNDAALRREIAVQTGTNYTGEEILKLYDEALSDIDTEIQKIKINFQKRFGIDNETAEYFLTQAQQEDNLKTLIKSLEYAPDEHKNQNHQDHTGDYQIDIRHIANGPAIVKEIHHFAVEEAVSVHNTVNQVAQSACKRERNRHRPFHGDSAHPSHSKGHASHNGQQTDYPSSA